MIQPINSISRCGTYKRNISFKDSQEKTTELQPLELAEKRDRAIINYIETANKTQKQNQLLTLISIGLIPLCLVPVFLFTKKNATKDKVDGLFNTFKSLKDDKTIPTLDTCNSINKHLKTFLENQVMYTKATKEDLIKTGAPEAANRLLMYGEPGSGKTFFAKIFAKTIDADYMEIKYSDINKRFCGEQIDHMKALFEDIIATGKKSPDKKFVLNFNEIDALAPAIDDLHGSSHGSFKKEERNAFLNFLQEVAEQAPNITIIGSSNAKPGTGIDGAVTSRFQNVIEVKYPNKECLLEALKEQISTLPDGKAFVENNKEKLEQFAQKMYERSASFRNLNNVMNESKNIYLRNVIKDKNSTFKYEYIEEALKDAGLTDGEISRFKGGFKS